ncbi:phage shock protein PspC (stress-responsive transcriptional regulator) [Lysobacter niastensis]|uniref:Phage shock protein PspC (Stress-responsive transcriptional regulator) n=1 Tax=Lysobacter niastensis TaxID=380629 RepID=A0ABU1W929_9GAMM|nr:hypothetical protein [Lysobacter niastensis]MDR7134090.1 phage shock protein PspC (stress-responsive transcriptional regulator) [Lysobacter niastensis]
MITRSHSSAVHLLLALPAAAYTSGTLIMLLMGGAEFVEQPFERRSLGELVLVPFIALVPALYILPIASIVGIPAYFVLRRMNLLRLRLFITLGVVPGLLVGLTTLSKVHSLLFVLAFAVFGALSGAIAYGVLAFMANRKSALA